MPVCLALMATAHMALAADTPRHHSPAAAYDGPHQSTLNHEKKSFIPYIPQYPIAATCQTNHDGMPMASAVRGRCLQQFVGFACAAPNPGPYCRLEGVVSELVTGRDIDVSAFACLRRTTQRSPRFLASYLAGGHGWRTAHPLPAPIRLASGHRS